MRLYAEVQFLLCGMRYRIATEIYLGIARYYCFQCVAQCVTLVDEHKCARAVTVFLITSQLTCMNNVRRYLIYSLQVFLFMFALLTSANAPILNVKLKKNKYRHNV